MLGSESQEIAPDTLEDIQAMDTILIEALLNASDGQPIILNIVTDSSSTLEQKHIYFQEKAQKFIERIQQIGQNPHYEIDEEHSCIHLDLQTERAEFLAKLLALREKVNTAIPLNRNNGVGTTLVFEEETTVTTEERKPDFTTQSDDASDHKVSSTVPPQDQVSEYRKRHKDAYEKQKQQETIAATEEKIKIFNEKLAQYKALRFCDDFFSADDEEELNDDFSSADDDEELNDDFSSADDEEPSKVFRPEDVNDFVTISQRNACDIATVSYFLDGENNEYGGLKEFLKKHIQCKAELLACIEGLPNAESIKQQMLNLLEPFEQVIRSTILDLRIYNENSSRSKDLSYPYYQEIITTIDLLSSFQKIIVDKLDELSILASANPNTSIANQRVDQANNTNEVIFQDIPAEISTHILSYLTDVELFKLTQVSKKTRDLANAVLLHNSTQAKFRARTGGYTFWLTLLRNPSETALSSYANEFYGLKNFTKKNLKKFFSLAAQDNRGYTRYELLKKDLQELIALVESLHEKHPDLVLLFLNDQLDSSYPKKADLVLFNSALCQLIPKAKQIEQRIDAEMLEIVGKKKTIATYFPFVSERFADHYHSIGTVLTRSAFSTRLDKDILFSFIQKSFHRTFISDFFSNPEYHVQLSKFNAKDILELLYNSLGRSEEDRLDKILEGIDAENPVLIKKFTPELIQALAMLSRKSYQEIEVRDALWTKLTIGQRKTIETFIEEIEEYHSSVIQPLLKKCDEIDKLSSDYVAYKKVYRNYDLNQRWPSLDEQCIFMLDTCQQLAVLKDAVAEHGKATENEVVTLSFLETSENNINNNNVPSESVLLAIVVSRAVNSVQNAREYYCGLFASQYDCVINEIRSFFVEENNLCAITSRSETARDRVQWGPDINAGVKKLKPLSDILNGLSKALMPIMGEASRPLLERQLMTEVLLPEIKQLKETITSLLYKKIEAFKKTCEDYKVRQKWGLSSTDFTFSSLNWLMTCYVQLSQTIDEALTLFNTTLDLSELTTCNAALAEGRNALISQASDAIKQYLERKHPALWFVPQQDWTLSQAEKFYGDAMTALSSAENTLISAMPFYEESFTVVLSKKKAEWDSFMTRMKALSQQNNGSSSSYKLVLKLGILSELQQESAQTARCYTVQELQQAADLYQSYYDDEIRSAMKTQYKLRIVITVLLSFLFTPISLCFTLPWTRRCKQEIDRIEHTLSELKTLEKSFPAQQPVTTTSSVTEDDSTSTSSGNAFLTGGVKQPFDQDDSKKISNQGQPPSLEISGNNPTYLVQHLTALRA